ncbi:MAG TPA: tetratricopeptide repeat-containing sensor histidine kinase [Bacteroidia bacterium]|nr:tetratricopeptide repeat-containing sensor histidine kinase [Bacteroidia bacterium]HRS58780.1 tetratricopeptide repeat-containing sensor histidine kinase [Bacteroidia bacterium]
MRILLPVLLILLLSFSVYSQNRTADSLRNLLKTKQLQPDKLIEVYLDLYDELLSENFDSAFNCLKHARKLSENSGNINLKAEIYYKLGRAYSKMNDSRSSLDAYLNSLNFYEKTHNTENQVFVYLSIGELMRSQAEYEKALEYLNTGLKIAKKYNHYAVIKSIFDRFGAVYFELNKYKETLSYIDSAIHFHSELNDKDFLVSIYDIKGAAWRELNNYDSAIFYLSKAAEYANTPGNMYLAGIYNNLSLVYLKMRNYKKASEYAHKSLAISLKDSVLDYMEVSFLNLSKIYQESKLPDSALQYFSHYTNVRWKKFNIEKSKDLARLQTKFELEAKKKENETLRLTNELQKQRLKLLSAGIIISILIVLILIAIPIYLDSKRKRLKKINEILQLKNDEIEQKARQLKELNETKDKLFSIIAHDIKNPLQSIIGFSELLENELSDKIDEETKQFINYIRQGGENLNFLLENLLRWSLLQSERHRFIFENVNLTDLIKHSTELFKTAITTKRINLYNNIEENLFVYVDQSAIATVFRNLISNAIKYSFAGGNIYLNSSKGKNHVTITIRDEGTGMHPDILKNVFTIGKSSQAGTTGEKGSGLGLILVKEFIEKNNGKLEIHSVISEGTTISVTLPIQSQEQN